MDKALRLPSICALVLFVVANSNAQSRNDCRTAKSEPGTCQSIYDCPTFLKIVREQPISKTDQQYLQLSLCQWQGKTPIVCCPRETSRPTQAPSPPPTTSEPVTNDSPDLTSHRSISLLPERICGRSFVSKIWGGNETQLGEYPWLALLGYRRSVNGPNTFLCGGALINPRYVLTAAHCTTNISPYSISTVRLGEHDQTTDIDCDENAEGDRICAPQTQNFNIERVITHPRYNSTTKHNDIALLRLNRPADTTTGYVTPICIPYHQSIAVKDYINEDLVVSGWGKVNPTTLFSNVKMAVNVPFREISQCRTQYRTAGREIIDKQMCAGGVAGKDSCTGDSGGPLMAIDSMPPDNTLKYFATGIVSYGPRDCGTQGWPGVYTRVGSYAKWILDNLEE